MVFISAAVARLKPDSALCGSSLIDYVILSSSFIVLLWLIMNSRFDDVFNLMVYLFWRFSSNL